MDKNLHILFLTPGFAKDTGDTVCIPALQVFLRTYATKYPGDRISIITFEYPYSYGHYDWHGIDVYSCGGSGSRLKRPLTLWRARRFFKQIHKLNPVTFIHSLWMGECAALGARLSKEMDIPHLITSMGQDALPSNIYLKKRDLLSANIIALSQTHFDIFQTSSGVSPIAIIPWGVEPLVLTEENRRVRPFDVIGAGNLTQLKNFSLFVDCIAALKTEMPDIKAVIVGDGPERISLQSKIDSLGLSRNIILKGQQSRDSALALMSQSKVLLHTSSYESFGYVFSEALASGAKLVSLKVGWAEPSDKWFVAESAESLVVQLKSALAPQKGEFTPFIPVSAAETAEKYHQFYESKTKLNSITNYSSLMVENQGN